MTNEKLSRLCLKSHKKSSYFVINQNKSFMYSFYIRELSVLFSDKQINTIVLIKKYLVLFVFELTFFLIGFQPIRKKPISKTTKYFFIVTKQINNAHLS